MDRLRKLYDEFLSLSRETMVAEAPHTMGVKDLNLTENDYAEVYDQYYRPSYLTFLQRIKTLLNTTHPLTYVTKEATDWYELYNLLKLLIDHNIMTCDDNGTAAVADVEFAALFPSPLTRDAIKTALENALNTTIREAKPVTDLLPDFTAKAAFDQLPISQGSALFLVEQLLGSLPLPGPFLFVGDDDFLSLLTSLVSPGFTATVADADDDVLSLVSRVAEQHSLPITTARADIRSPKTLGSFIGFHVNPIYTETGVREFTAWGVKQLGPDGGLVSLVVGDESIGNRFLFLQEFFAEQRLILKELHKGAVSYPFIDLHNEDERIINRIAAITGKHAITSHPRLGASLYLFDYLPFTPKKNLFKKSLYAYL